MSRDNLLQTVQETGRALLDVLFKASDKYPQLLSAIRGQGTLVAFDLPTSEQRDTLVQRLKDNGVLVGACGPTSVRFRPTLTCSVKHIQQFRPVSSPTYVHAHYTRTLYSSGR